MSAEAFEPDQHVLEQSRYAFTRGPLEGLGTRQAFWLGLLLTLVSW